MTGNGPIFDDAIISQAVPWHIRIEGGEMFALDWESFTTWLERDANHSAAYDLIVETDGDLLAVLADRDPNSATQAAAQAETQILHPQQPRASWAAKA